MPLVRLQTAWHGDAEARTHCMLWAPWWNSQELVQVLAMSGCMLAWAKTIDTRCQTSQTLIPSWRWRREETRMLPTRAKRDLDRLRPAPFDPRAVSQRICACLLHPHLCFLQKERIITKCFCWNFDFLTFSCGYSFSQVNDHVLLTTLPT